MSVTEESTNTVVKTVTSDSGDYMVNYLKPGSYKVQFASPGFKEHLETGIALQINQSRRVDPTLEVGQVTETVEVSASSAQVNYGVARDRISVVDADQLTNLPEQATSSRGRSPFLLAKLLPGVTTNGNTYTNINGFSFAGGRRDTNEILVDGLPTTNPSDETYTLTPSPDSIQEFQSVDHAVLRGVRTYRRRGDDRDTRGGGNTLHGSLTICFAIACSTAAISSPPAQSTAKYVQNDPGGNIGGPVYVPKLYDGRNKTFFFVDFNVTLASQGGAFSGLVPTDLQKSGDFSQTFFANGSLVPIYDPTTEHLGPDGKTIVRDPFPGNVIPASRIDPVAAKIVKFYPTPNANINGNNYFVTPPATMTTGNIWAASTRTSAPTTAPFSASASTARTTTPRSTSPTRRTTTTAGGWTDTQAVLSETHIFSPTLVNDFRFGWVQEDNYTTVLTRPCRNWACRA